MSHLISRLMHTLGFWFTLALVTFLGAVLLTGLVLWMLKHLGH